MMWTDYYKDLPIPSDWENVSYGNDELPSFACNGYQIWINSPNIEERKESYLGLGFGTLTDYEDWIFHVRYYFDEETKKEHIKKEEGYFDGFYFTDFQKVLNFVNKPSLYALLCLLELDFNWQIPFHKFDENALLEFIEDLLNGKTEYYLDSKFPRKTFETFLKENAK
tara:strand:+ start:229 stop:732 length:504 start_codon:yes stop_codon:yes gene_type:complete